MEIALKHRLQRLFWVCMAIGAVFYLVAAIIQQTLNPLVVGMYLVKQTYGIFHYQLGQFSRHISGFGIFGFKDASAFLFLLIPIAAALVLEIAWYGWQRRSLSAGWKASALSRLIALKDPSARTDVVMILYNLFSLEKIVVGLLGLLGPFILYGMLVNNFKGISLTDHVELHPVAAFALYILLADFLWYWVHRAEHWLQPLWELHKFHHSATNMNMVTAHRTHPLEAALHLPIKAIPVIVVGPNLDTYLFYHMCITFIIMLQHSNFAWKWGVLDSIIVSPQFHRLHHCSLPEHHDRNFAVLFSFWDTLFGSRYRGDNQTVVFGVTQNYFNEKGTFSDLFTPMKKFFGWMATPRLTIQKTE